MKSSRSTDSADERPRKQQKLLHNGNDLAKDNNNGDKEMKFIENNDLLDMGVKMLPGGDNQQVPVSSLDTVIPATEAVSSDFVLRRRRISAVKKEGKDAFEMLSDELVLMVLQYLPKKSLVECAQVCKRWRRVSYDEALWTRIDLSGKKLHADTMAYVFMRNPRILRMAQVEVVSPLFKEMAPAMEDIACKVEYLDLSMAVINSEDLSVLLGKCRELRKLSLEHCITDLKVCNSIAQNTHLDTLNLALCYELSSEGITKILTECKNIVDLNLAWTYLDEKSVTCICNLVSSKIRNLDFSGCRKNMSNSHVERLVTRCKDLTELDLSDNTQLQDEVVDMVMENLKRLQAISFSRCYRIMPAMYGKLIKMSSLRSLNIYGLLHDKQVDLLQQSTKVKVNKSKFSTIARPTVGIRRTSIWGLRVRD